MIVTLDPAFHAAVGADPAWRGVRAVRAGRVYLVPLLPFPWIDFPPVGEPRDRAPLAGPGALSRGCSPADLRDEARAFYGLFYHRAPDERQLDSLLGARP